MLTQKEKERIVEKDLTDGRSSALEELRYILETKDKDTKIVDIALNISTLYNNNFDFEYLYNDIYDYIVQKYRLEREYNKKW